MDPRGMLLDALHDAMLNSMASLHTQEVAVMNLPVGRPAVRWRVVTEQDVLIRADLSESEAVDVQTAHPGSHIERDHPLGGRIDIVSDLSKKQFAARLADALLGVRRDQLDKAYEQYTDNPSGFNTSYLHTCTLNYRDAYEARVDIGMWND